MRAPRLFAAPLIALALLLPVAARATTYHVRPAASGGSDSNDGLSFANSFATIGKVNQVAQASASDAIVFVYGAGSDGSGIGTYVDWPSPSATASSGKRFRFYAATNAGVDLSGTRVTIGTSASLTLQKSFITMQGFRLGNDLQLGAANPYDSLGLALSDSIAHFDCATGKGVNFRHARNCVISHGTIRSNQYDLGSDPIGENNYAKGYIARVGVDTIYCGQSALPCTSGSQTGSAYYFKQLRVGDMFVAPWLPPYTRIKNRYSENVITLTKTPLYNVNSGDCTKYKSHRLNSNNVIDYCSWPSLGQANVGCHYLFHWLGIDSTLIRWPNIEMVWDGRQLGDFGCNGSPPEKNSGPVNNYSAQRTTIKYGRWHISCNAGTVPYSWWQWRDMCAGIAFVQDTLIHEGTGTLNISWGSIGDNAGGPQDITVDSCVVVDNTATPSSDQGFFSFHDGPVQRLKFTNNLIITEKKTAMSLSQLRGRCRIDHNTFVGDPTRAIVDFNSNTENDLEGQYGHMTAYTDTVTFENNILVGISGSCPDGSTGRKAPVSFGAFWFDTACIGSGANKNCTKRFRSRNNLYFWPGCKTAGHWDRDISYLVSGSTYSLSAAGDDAADALAIWEGAYDGNDSLSVHADPLFTNSDWHYNATRRAGTLFNPTLLPGSPAIGKATDGANIGCSTTILPFVTFTGGGTWGVKKLSQPIVPGAQPYERGTTTRHVESQMQLDDLVTNPPLVLIENTGADTLFETGPHTVPEGAALGDSVASVVLASSVEGVEDGRLPYQLDQLLICGLGYFGYLPPGQSTQVAWRLPGEEALIFTPGTALMFDLDINTNDPVSPKYRAALRIYMDAPADTSTADGGPVDVR